MDFGIFLTSSSIDKLKCSKCHNFLSYFPIFSTPRNDNFCGRCVSGIDEPGSRNVAFEIVSQFIKFPCGNVEQGCTEECLPDEIPEHERQCPFRILPCVVNFSQVCDWEGGRLELISHCKNRHESFFLKNSEFVIDTTADDQNSYSLIEHEDVLLIFKKTFDTKTQTLKLRLFLNEFALDAKKFQVRLSAKSGEKTLSYDFETTVFDEAVTNELSLESLRGCENGTVTFTMKIGKEIEEPNRILNYEMLAILKCFMCRKYAAPPIYHCVKSSETVCSDCKNVHQYSCSSCLTTSHSTRNINLDKMANMLNYSCENETNGCSYISKPERIRNHELNCKLRNFECPLRDFEVCGWKGACSIMEEHIQNTHQELVSNRNVISKCLLPQHLKCDIIKFSNMLFRLVVLRTPENNYKFTVQHVTPSELDFKYEIDILDPLDQGRRLLIRKRCGVLCKKDQLFKNRNYVCCFLKQQISDFIVNQIINFKVYIFV